MSWTGCCRTEAVLLPLLREKKLSLRALGCFDKVFKIPVPTGGADESLLEDIRVRLVRQFGSLVDILSATHDIAESLETHQLVELVGL